MLQRFRDAIKPRLRPEQISPKWKTQLVIDGVPVGMVELTKYTPNNNQTVSDSQQTSTLLSMG